MKKTDVVKIWTLLKGDITKHSTVPETNLHEKLSGFDPTDIPPFLNETLRQEGIQNRINLFPNTFYHKYVPIHNRLKTTLRFR